MKNTSILVIAVLLGFSGCQSNNDAQLSKENLELTSDSSEEATGTDASEEGTDTDSADAGEVTEAKGKSTPDKINTASISNQVMKYEPPKPGTVYTWRNNWANLPKQLSYRVDGTLKMGGNEYVKFSSVKGFKNKVYAFYNTKDFSLKGYRNSSDKAIVTFKPTEQRYKFPMKPGDKWISSWKQLDHKSKRVTSGGGVVKVLRWETLKLPAGTFRTLVVRQPIQKNAPRGMTHYTWFAPELGITVKEQIGGGIMNWTQILEKIEKP